MATRGGRTIAALARRRNQKVANVVTNPYHLLQIVDPQPPTPGTPISPTSKAIHAQIQEARKITADLEQITKVRSSLNEAFEALKNYDPSITDRMGDDKGEKPQGASLDDILAKINEGQGEMREMNGKIDGLATRMGNVELNVNSIMAKKKLEPSNPAIQPQRNEELLRLQHQENLARADTESTSVSVPVPSIASQEAGDIWNENEEEHGDDEEGDPWNLVVRGLSKSTRRYLPNIKENEENLRLGGYQPSRQEINRHNRLRTRVVREIDSTVRNFDEQEQNDFPARSAYGRTQRESRKETIRKIGSQMDGIKNPANRKVERWVKESIENPSWNVFVNPKLYKDLQQVINREPPPNIKTPKDQNIFKITNLMKREVLIGPFRQEDWAARDDKAGGMQHRPSYLMKMLCDHLVWFLDIPDEQLTSLKVVSIKPAEEALSNLYPSQLRVTFTDKEMADLLLMHHSQNESRFVKRASKCKIMLTDEFMTRYRQLATVASLRRNSFNAESKNGAKMFTFITYSAQSLEIVSFRTNNKKKEWVLMKTPHSVTASMWEDSFEVKKGTRLEPFQRRIMEKKDAKKVDFGGRVLGKWTMPVIKKYQAAVDPTKRTSSTMNGSAIDQDLDDNNRKHFKTGDETSSESSESEHDEDVRSVLETLRLSNDDIYSHVLTDSLVQPDGLLTVNTQEDSTDEDLILPRNDIEKPDLSEEIVICNNVEYPDCSSPFLKSDTINANLDNIAVQDHVNVSEVDPCFNDGRSVSLISDALNDTRFLDVETNDRTEGETVSLDSSHENICNSVSGTPSPTSDRSLTPSSQAATIRPEFIVEGDYSLTNESETRKLEMRITIPEFVMDVLCPVLFSLLPVADCFRINNCLLRIEESKKAKKAFRISECSDSGQPNGHEAQLTLDKSIRLWSRGKTVVSRRNLVHLLWSEFLEKLLLSTMAAKEEGNEPLTGKCSHPSCDREAFMKCPICYRFIHENCSNRGTCKKKCERKSSEKFITDKKLLESQLRRTFLNIAERRERNEEIKTVLKQLENISNHREDSGDEDENTPGVIVEAGEQCESEKCKPFTGDMDINLMEMLDITEEDIIKENLPPNQDMIFTMNFPDGWTKWQGMRTHKKFRNLFFLEETVVDGDCFYDSIGKVLTLEEDFSFPAEPMKMRERLLTNFYGLKVMDTWVEACYGGDKSKKNTIIRQHLRHGQYTDDEGFIVQGAAEVLKRELRIVSDGYFNSDTPYWYKSFKPTESDYNNPNPIWLGYSMAGQHYRALFQKNRYVGLKLAADRDKDEGGAASLQERVSPDQPEETPPKTPHQSEQRKGRRAKLDKQELDERRRRREYEKSDLVHKLEAAETHIINLSRSLAQQEEKTGLLQEKIDTLELYCNSLEHKNLKWEARLKEAGVDDPENDLCNPAFTSRDTHNIIDMKNKLTSVLEHVSLLTLKIDKMQPDTNPSAISGQNVRADQILKIPDSAPQNSPSRMPFQDKRRKFEAAAATTQPAAPL